jgi:hypothetical protein
MPAAAPPAAVSPHADHLSVLADAGLLSAEQLTALGAIGNVTPADLAQWGAALTGAWADFDTSTATGDDVAAMAASFATAKLIAAELSRRRQVVTAQTGNAEQLVAALRTSAQTIAAAGTASGVRLPRISRLAARRPSRLAPAGLRPGAAAATQTVLTAAGQRVPSGDLAAVMAVGIEHQVRDRKHWDGGNVYLARIRTEYPAERRLDGSDTANGDRIAAVTAPAALVASGGVCAPVGVSYDVQSITDASRPLQTGALAAFEAARGGVRYVLPHTLAQVTADGPAAIWTEANDVNPGNPASKPHATFGCQQVMEAYVDAVTSIVQFGNFQARYFPESIAQYLEAASAVHARLAEGNLLAQLSAGSTQVSADNYELGAARDLLAILDRAAAAMRYRHRMGAGAPLRLVAPEWVLDMVRADLARQLPGDSGTGAERLAIGEQQLLDWLTTRSLNLTRTMDSPNTGAAVSTAQGWGQQGPGELLPWPAVTSVWLYPEGSWLFLDGGTLDLGMVRDSILNRTNDFQMFSESFEKAVFVGHESQQINMKLAPTGASAGTVATYPADPGQTIGS